MGQVIPTEFKKALREYIDVYLRPRLNYEGISGALGKSKTWLTQYLGSQRRGITPKTLSKLYALLPELAEDIKEGAVEHPIVRGQGRPVRSPVLTVTVKGPSGSGKTSLISLLANVLLQKQADVTIIDDTKEIFSLDDSLMNVEEIVAKGVTVRLTSERV